MIIIIYVLPSPVNLYIYYNQYVLDKYVYALTL